MRTPLRHAERNEYDAAKGSAVKSVDAVRRDGLSRRKFIERLGLLTTVGGLSGGLGVAAPSWAGEADAGPVDCGPPPPAKPHHQTGGESFPPLPLPATPLRRSEKKRPPSPPALVGKMPPWAPTRWITKDGKRVQYRDWMTDPADVMTLLAWTGRQAGDQLSGGRGRFRPFLVRSPRAAGVALGRAQQVRADRRGPREVGPLCDGRRHDPRRRLLRLERFRRVVPPRDRS